MDPIVVGLIYCGVVLVGAALVGLSRLGQRRCKRRLLMFDNEADVKDAAERGELTELHDALDIQAMKAELFDLVSHRCNGRLSPDADDCRDTECTGCARTRVLQYQLREAEAEEGKP